MTSSKPRNTYPARYAIHSGGVVVSKHETIGSARVAMVAAWRERRGEVEVAIVDESLCLVTDALPPRPQAFGYDLKK